MSEDFDVKNDMFHPRYIASLKFLFSQRLSSGLFGLLLIGCTSATPQTQQRPVTSGSEVQLTSKDEGRTTSSLDVQLMPEKAARILLNPSSVDERYYVTGITVTIDVIPEPG